MVFIPFISTRNDNEALLKRKGGGRGGGGFGGGRSGGRTSSSGHTSSSSSSSSKSPAFSIPSSSGKKGSSVHTYGNGGGKVSSISSGSFSGRTQGGGTRSQVYGSSVYGSGYPAGYGSAGRGVTGAGFPFYFWPLVWGGAIGYTAGYLHDENEYGKVDNSSRPGGALYQVPIVSPSSASFVSTYHLIADHDTVTALISSISSNCTGISNAPLQASALASNASSLAPETAIQYYRASSVALTLDGYNNTAALSNDTSATAMTPIPSAVNMTFLTCLNETIGASVPLVDSAHLGAHANVGLLIFSIALVMHNLF
ncbi:hypothetical protein EXIGLDRAFT_653630 [Exidia glandulosa HHB12029]|uniref:Glycine-rich protein n=1 Tax=Exidia glandulosa HHB12029 TaxID=1314781 RepID=A0A165E268_EXIGL|nr:hypothetical protein EXIGLDRAFT_653630 [Exidia glandulosa HHB12029]